MLLRTVCRPELKVWSIIVAMARPTLDPKWCALPTQFWLAVKVVHRARVEEDGTHELREPDEAYASNFTGKNEVLRSENTLFGMKLSRMSRHGLVSPNYGSWNTNSERGTI